MPVLNVFKVKKKNSFQIIKILYVATNGWWPRRGVDSLISKPSLISLPEGDMLFEVQEGFRSEGLSSRFSIFKQSWRTF